MSYMNNAWIRPIYYTWSLHEKDPYVKYEQCMKFGAQDIHERCMKRPLYTSAVNEKNPYVIHKQCMKRTLMSYIYAVLEKDPYVMYHQSMKMAFMSFMNSACLGGSVGCTSNWWSGDCMLDHGLVGNILLWRWVMKYFLPSFSPFCWFKKDSCQFLAKGCVLY